MADILRDLNSSPQWSSVIAALTDHCIQQLPIQLKRSNLFTLLVLVGFPEVPLLLVWPSFFGAPLFLWLWVSAKIFFSNALLSLQVLCMGSHSTFMDNANEQHCVILLKHFTEKNRAAVVDVRTRKRRTGEARLAGVWGRVSPPLVLTHAPAPPSVKDYQLVQPPDGQCAPVGPVPLARYLEHFTAICSQLLQSELEGSTPDAVEATWVLSLALKGLYTSLKVSSTLSSTLHLLDHEYPASISPEH